VHLVFLTLQLDPGGILSWLLVGLLAGALAGRVVRGRGYGCLVDIVVGVAGAFIGGILLGYFIQGVAGFWESLVVAFIGAVVLLGALRLVSGSKT
jgi:uncharacterized membrane protein YeaQ/YmgE (transglycosylase-associated protein family)